ncbi:MAG: hypothetical protein ABI863_13695 [Ginsengibacter sp.]
MVRASCIYFNRCIIVQALQMAGVFSYPPDEILIYGTSLCIVIPFIMEILALHYVTPGDKKFRSHAALIFIVIYSVFVTMQSQKAY